MKITIDGIEYKPVEQKVDKEREDAIRAMRADINATNYSYGWDAIAIIYDAGYRKVGEEVSEDDMLEALSEERRRVFWLPISDELLKHFDITKKVVK